MGADVQGGESQWHPVLESGALDETGMQPVTVGGQKLIVLRADGAVAAYRDACPHEGYALSVHGNKQLWEFDAATGEHISRIPRPQCNLKRVAVREAGGMIEVDLGTA
jgi:nitrite reductase/ring-hydroxylating ferredoxin subunit